MPKNKCASLCLKLFGIILVTCLCIINLPQEMVMEFNTSNMRAFWAALDLFWSKNNPYSQIALSNLIEQSLGIKAEVEYIWHLPAIFIFPLLIAHGSYLHFLYMELIITIIPFIVCAFILLENGPTTGKYKFLELLFLACFFPGLLAISSSPNSNCAALFFVLSLYLERKQSAYSKFLAAFLLAITMIKPNVLYLVYAHLFYKAILQRKPAVILAFVFATSVVVLSPLLANPHIYQYYYELYKSPPTNWMNPTLGTYLQFLIGEQSSLIKFTPMIVCLIFYFILQTRLYFKEKTFFEFEIIAAFSLLSTPYLWGYNFVFLLPLLYQSMTKLPSLLIRKSINLLTFAVLNAVFIAMNFVPLFWTESRKNHIFIWYPICAILIWFTIDQIYARKPRNNAAIINAY